MITQAMDLIGEDLTWTWGLGAAGILANMSGRAVATHTRRILLPHCRILL